MKRIANERKYVKDMIKNKTLNSSRPGKDLNSLIKYVYECNPQITKNDLINTVNEILFEIVKDEKAISRWQVSIKEYVENFLSSATKFKGLSHVESICLTEAELKKIQEINNKKLEKVAFALLVYLKINNSIRGNLDNVYCPSDTKDLKIIKSIVGMQITVANLALLMKQLQDLGYTSNGIGGAVNCKINYIENSSKIAIEIKDFNVNHLITYYDSYKKSIKLTHCEVCGAVVAIASNRTKYCKKCAVQVNITKTNTKKTKLC